jgi:flagellar biosynthesis protein FlhF
MMRQQKARQQSVAPDVPERLMDQYLALLQQEVAEELADELVQEVRDRLDEAQIEDPKACRGAVAGAVAELLPVDPTAGKLLPSGDHRPRVIALVGPTGVGKTTTVAKLAATFKLKQNKKVALITLDTYRIAAVEQLRTYASIIGVPLHVVLAPDDLRRAIDECAGFDAVLIDTAGRSQRDDGRLEELSRFIDAAQPHEVHLVLSSTCAQSVLMEAVERFSRIRTDRIIFTKLDEAVSFGVLLNVLRKVDKKLSYITTGQEVPHQIEPGNSARLAALLLGEGAVAP